MAFRSNFFYRKQVKLDNAPLCFYLFHLMNNKTSVFAYVKVKNNEQTVAVPIGVNKPEIPKNVQEKWQQIVDLVARIMNVPTGLLTRFTRENLEIFLASDTQGNPYSKEDRDSLGIGMFCETVAARREEMLVQNTEDTPYWKNNPHAGLGMRSYMGIPIMWADGEIFGTFCMLNSQPNQFTQDFKQLLHHFKELIEQDLQNIQRNHELLDELCVKEKRIREAHYMVRNHFNMLVSFIHLENRSGVKDREKTLLSLGNRIQTLSLIHEKLYSSVDYGDLPIDQYIMELCNLLTREAGDSQIEIEYQINPLVLKSASCVSLGLIISEIISNVQKHTSKKEGFRLLLNLHPVTKDKLRFSIKEEKNSDIAGKIQEDKDASLSLSLIESIAGQMKSTARVCREQHTLLEMDFPLEG